MQRTQRNAEEKKKLLKNNKKKVSSRRGKIIGLGMQEQ